MSSQVDKLCEGRRAFGVFLIYNSSRWRPCNPLGFLVPFFQLNESRLVQLHCNGLQAGANLRFSLRASQGLPTSLGLESFFPFYQTCLLQAGPQPCKHSLLSESLLLPPFTRHRVFCHDVYNLGAIDLKFLYITYIMKIKQYLCIYL